MIYSLCNDTAALVRMSIAFIIFGGAALLALNPAWDVLRCTEMTRDTRRSRLTWPITVGSFTHPSGQMRLWKSSFLDGIMQLRIDD